MRSASTMRRPLHKANILCPSYPFAYLKRMRGLKRYVLPLLLGPNLRDGAISSFAKMISRHAQSARRHDAHHTADLRALWRAMRRASWDPNPDYCSRQRQLPRSRGLMIAALRARGIAARSCPATVHLADREDDDPAEQRRHPRLGPGLPQSPVGVNWDHGAVGDQNLISIAVARRTSPARRLVRQRMGSSRPCRSQ